MIKHVAVQYACRTLVQTLSVCTTGSVTLTATTTGYTRAAGSFVTDGFAVGMEITPTGFASNPVDTITWLNATTITTQSSRTAESALTAQLAVGLPRTGVWENLSASPSVGQPWWQEQYLPGPSPRQTTLGATGWLEYFPVYGVVLNVPRESGFLAASSYADALIGLFAPGTVLTPSDGSDARVRRDVGPYRTALRDSPLPNVFTTSVLIPLWVRTRNTV